MTDPFDPTQAVDGAARLLSDLLDRFGSTELGAGRLQRRARRGAQYDGIPPYAGDPELRALDHGTLEATA